MRDTIGQYRVLDRLGAGGIGDVYRARDTRLGRTVAIRFVSADIASTPARRARFVADVNSALSLSHPNVAALYEVGDDQGQLFLAMEYVPGDPLTRLTAGHALNVRRAIGYAIQIADAIADAHAFGVAHGDLCASNVIITPRGNAKLLEFGLTSWTAGGRARGTRDDIVSLGHLIVEMTSGEPVGHQTPRGAGAKPAGSAPGLDAIVARMLAGDADGGYPSAAIVAAELRDVAAALDEKRANAEPISVRPQGGPAPASESSPPRLAILLMVAAALACIGWILTLQ